MRILVSFVWLIRSKVGDKVTECMVHPGPATCEIKRIICSTLALTRRLWTNGLDFKIGAAKSVNL